MQFDRNSNFNVTIKSLFQLAKACGAVAFIINMSWSFSHDKECPSDWNFYRSFDFWMGNEERIFFLTKLLFATQ